MVSATQRANAAHGSVKIDLISTAELGNVNFSVQCMRNVANFTAIGNLLANQHIQLLEVDLPISKLHSLHTAADIHADHTGYNLVLNGHGSANGTALTSVDIRHDPDLTAGKLFLIAYCLDLLVCRFLQLWSITDRSVI